MDSNRKPIDTAFEVHMLNETGKSKAEMIAVCFDDLLKDIKTILDPIAGNPQGREFSIVRTKLEEACFFAKKAMATIKGNQS